MSKRHRTAAIVAGIALAIAIGHPADAAPARSGTIIGGWFPFAAVAPGPGPDCSTDVDCLVWLTAGCKAALAGVDPALHASIVDVRALAGSNRVRRFTIEAIGPSVIFGGVAVQFWDGACTQLRGVGGPGFASGVTNSARFKVPRGARWMTVASVDSTTLRWALS